MNLTFIPYGHQNINQTDIQAVVDVLQSDWLTQGPVIEAFEKKVADYCGAKYAVAVSSATAALHNACLASGLESEQALWTTPNTFVASANCGLYCGAQVDFVDIDSQTYNMSVKELEEKLLEKSKTGKLPKVIVPVHFSGQSCEMESIFNLAKQYGCTVIEDASHAIGGIYKNKPIGSCTYSDMTVFSFHPVKIITTGEGGIVLTNKEALYEKLLLFRSHGITRKKQYMTEEQGSWYYQQINLGYNYRMTDLQAALGLSQMGRIDEFIKKRRQLVQRYEEKLQKLPLILPFQHEDAVSAWHLYVIQIKLAECTKTRKEIFEGLRNAGIGVNVHYIPVHTQPYYQKLGFKKGDFPVSEAYYEAALSLPLYYDLTEKEQDYVVAALKRVMEYHE